jgi:hypothetical protein
MVQLQVEPGLFGVIKLQWRTWPTRNWLSFAAAGVFLSAASVLVAWQHRMVPAPPQWYITFRWVVLGALVLIVALRLLLEGTVSKPPPGTPPKWDRLLADPWWTPIHFLTGVTLGVWLVPFVLVVTVTIAWELLEISVPGFGDEEITGNRLIDILVAWIGWLIAVLITGGFLGVSLPLA